MKKNINRIGECKKMNNGLHATIINYKTAKSIDIQFENGTIVCNKGYNEFKQGSIKCPGINPYIEKHKSRLGEKVIHGNGLAATIVEYRASNDIDVLFEDGYIYKHEQYYRFKRGKTPYDPENKKNKSIIGEQNKMSCGLLATIISENSKKDIVVKFENGETTKTTYYRFCHGKVSLPQYNNTHLCETATSRLGEKNKMTCGLNCEIIQYDGYKEITVMFEDGEVVAHTNYQSFRNGTIAHPLLSNAGPNARNRQKLQRLGTAKQMNCGACCTIIEYRTAHDIDVKFEDGYIVKHRAYRNFNNGTISHPMISHGGVSGNELVLAYYFGKLGFKKANKGTLKRLGFGHMELDLYNDNYNGFKVAIEYDGFEKSHTEKRDSSKNKICKQANITLIRIRSSRAEQYVAENVIPFVIKDASFASKDLEAAIHDVIAFLNKSFNTHIHENINFDHDKKTIARLKVNYFRSSNKCGIKNKMSNGMDASIIAYRGTNDIDVMFEDGAIVVGTRMSQFNLGNVQHPNNHHLNFVDHNCETKTMNCGIDATIIRYNGSEDIDILFADGTVVKNRSYGDFRVGKIKHPNINQSSYTKYKRKDRVGVSNMMSNGHTATIIEYESSKNITVQFENGVIKKNCNYGAFKKGLISPTVKHSHGFDNKTRETRVVNDPSLKIF